MGEEALKGKSELWAHDHRFKGTESCRKRAAALRIRRPENKQPNSFHLCYTEKETISQKERIGAQYQ
ncbi:hypothetical protein MtrunA17_Chr4g0067751 [Medicago truncatula]|uniref:Uncharacterized protein n=1 Tax=Medicago truncatula TaxID=3880 RepID=A0A396IHH7_MEDTR|nr:hypothetical protein MtrunA17_Chr4g0067751 [Medicago truncatula]